MDNNRAELLTKDQLELIESLLDLYDSKLSRLKTTMTTLVQELSDNEDLNKLIHSLRWRLKSRDHLRDKLMRKIHDGIVVDSGNFFSVINDMVGVRILHLHSRQFVQINSLLHSWIEENNYTLLEGPFARAWDDERRRFFQEIGINVRDAHVVDGSPSWYTSVHYVVRVSKMSGYTFEIQVRTLLEEVWGEVDHSMNYPERSRSASCQEQLKALARLTSGCDRLVDSVYETHRLHTNAAVPRTERHSEA